MSLQSRFPLVGPPLDLLCPMHLIVAPTGHIRHVGPTLHKLRPTGLLGERFLEVFELKRPRNINIMSEIMNLSGTKLHLKFRDLPATSFQGIGVNLPQDEGAIINLSFGISILDAVRDYNLTSADFAATDMAIEMLYLVEAKSAAMEASRTLNQRLQSAKIAAEEQAFTDTLTGLKNRRALDHILPRQIESGAEFALMQMDLDYFKAVNDTMGHAAGDLVLQHVARILVEETREEDDAIRLGGDEFVLLFPGGMTRTKLGTIAQRIIKRIQQPIQVQDDLCRISASIGIAVGRPHEVKTVDEIYEEADIALYHCKENGKGQYAFFDKTKAKPQSAK